MNHAVPSPVKSAIEQWLTADARYDVAITSFTFASGGCINKGGTIATSAGDFFLKWNDAAKYPLMFQAEAEGLRVLRENAKTLSVPEPLYHGETGGYQFLLMTHQANSPKSKNYWSDLGGGLARLHRVTSDTFGLEHDNWIGSLPQQNHRSASWIVFFQEQRLQRQLDVGLASGVITTEVMRKFDVLFGKLDELLYCERPSLLHGDLWSGNVMSDEKGSPVLIDPAVYFGHRETDLAMTQLFGGFDKTFYGAYTEEFPLESGYEERFDIYNLYPLLVHVNLFGPGYLAQVKAILQRYR